MTRAGARVGTIAALGLLACGAPKPDQILPLAELFPEAEPRAAADGRSPSVSQPGVLELPAGSRVDFFLELRAGARLRAEALPSPGSPGLEVEVECDGERVEEAAVSVSSSGAVEARLRSRWASATPCRVTLLSRQRAGAAAPGQLLLRAAGVHQPAPPVAPRQATPARHARPNVVIYLVDTLRSDRLGAYGSDRGLTPTMDALAREGVTVLHGRAQSSWTPPTVATILSGRLPIQHGVHRPGQVLADSTVTLAERLRALGYQTGAVSTNLNITGRFGFDQGFESFTSVAEHRADGNSATWSRALPEATRFLESTTETRPFFLYLHTFEPHLPYEPPAHLRRRLAPGAPQSFGLEAEIRKAAQRGLSARELGWIESLYDAEVASADEGLAAFLAELRRLGKLDATILLLISDHGEELDEHGGWSHGYTLYEELLRVPMIWRLPGVAGGRRVDATVDQMDIVPTLLELVGAPQDPTLLGRSAAPALRGEATLAERPSPAWLVRAGRNAESLAWGELKLVSRAPGSRAARAREQLFDLRSDPGERRNLASARVVLRGFLAAKLRWWRRIGGPADRVAEPPIDEELRRNLAALGYL